MVVHYYNYIIDETWLSKRNADKKWLNEAEAKLKDDDGDKAKAKARDGEMDNSGKCPETNMFTLFVAFAMMGPYVPEGFLRQTDSFSSLTLM
jgi:hypothetical protein